MTAKGNRVIGHHGQLWSGLLVVVILLTGSACGSRKAGSAATAGSGENGAHPASSATSTPAPPPTATATATLAPESPEALANASALLHDGYPKEAAQAYGAIASGARDAGVRGAAALGAAVAEIAAEQTPAAIEHLKLAVASAPAGGETRLRATYLLGLQLDATGDHAGAAAALAPLAGTSAAGPLQPYVLVAYARALEGAKDPAAAAIWDRVAQLPGLPASFALTVARQRVDAARGGGDDTLLAHALTEVVNRSGDPAARFELASAALRLGDRATFVGQLRAIITQSPAATVATAALAALKSAGEPVDPGDEGYVDYRRGLPAQAIAVLSVSLAEPGLSPSAFAFRGFYLAASYEDANDATSAERLYDQVAAAGGSSPYVHRAMYWAARVAEGLDDFAGAAARYEALAATGPPGEFSAEAAFRAGYVRLQAKDASGAVSAWDRLGVGDDARVLYWKARADEQLGRSADATAAYLAANRADPLGFYGSEAGRRVGKVPALNVSFQVRSLDGAIGWPALEQWLATKVAGSAPAAEPTAAADLLALGLREDAASALFEAADGSSTWRIFVLMKEARALGMYDVAAQLAVKIQKAAGAGWESVPKDLLRIAYPVDYVALVTANTRSANVDPLFFAAVVRQESYWDPAAGSYAGALGLTQVIPPTGEDIARALGVNGFTPGTLFQPATSLRFGAWYLGDQIVRYGSPYLALGAYNAGPGNAARWAQDAGPGADGPTTAEAIDIGETRDYVEKILEHYARYLAAYAAN